MAASFAMVVVFPTPVGPTKAATWGTPELLSLLKKSLVDI